jgi:hypothetical protein
MFSVGVLDEEEPERKAKERTKRLFHLVLIRAQGARDDSIDPTQQLYSACPSSVFRQSPITLVLSPCLRSGLHPCLAREVNVPRPLHRAHRPLALRLFA